MNKKTVIAYVLIGLVIIGFFKFNQKTPEEAARGIIQSKCHALIILYSLSSFSDSPSCRVFLGGMDIAIQEGFI